MKEWVDVFLGLLRLENEDGERKEKREWIPFADESMQEVLEKESSEETEKRFLFLNRDNQIKDLIMENSRAHQEEKNKKDGFPIFSQQKDNKKPERESVFLWKENTKQKETQTEKTQDQMQTALFTNSFLSPMENEAGEQKRIPPEYENPFFYDIHRTFDVEEAIQKMGVYFESQKGEGAQNVTVQIGQVRETADIDQVMTEITKRLQEARSVSRCKTRRR